jgi:hypothetical protein
MFLIDRNELKTYIEEILSVRVQKITPKLIQFGTTIPVDSGECFIYTNNESKVFVCETVFMQFLSDHAASIITGNVDFACNQVGGNTVALTDNKDLIGSSFSLDLQVGGQVPHNFVVQNCMQGVIFNEAKLSFGGTSGDSLEFNFVAKGYEVIIAN